MEREAFRRAPSAGVGDLLDDLSGEREADAAGRIVDAAFRDRQVAAARAALRVQLLQRLGSPGG